MVVAAAATHLLPVSVCGSHVWVPGLPRLGVSIAVSSWQGPKERASLGPWYTWVQSLCYSASGCKEVAQVCVGTVPFSCHSLITQICCARSPP